MQIRIESLLEGAAKAQGAVAIIDVFRAFTTAAFTFSNGAKQVVMVGEVEEAMRLRETGIGHLCIGEVHGKKPDAFDFGNSPAELLSANLQGKTVIQRTSAGTQGIVTAAPNAEHMFAASLVTASATARALRETKSQIVTLVAMGNAGTVRTMEDEICALHLRNLLEDRSGNVDTVQKMIRTGKEVLKFGDPKYPWFRAEDIELALDVDRFDFAIHVAATKHGLIAKPVRYRIP
ncbi:MAG: 2-phosphosulfolactate phosphatase [Desulfobulbaceae bacterium]|nr:2-phosphosulfolactate phosphatase [Desulfobulbaceae bacterium]